MTTRINLCSGPRNISTALMYSFRQRPDTTVVDEPLYAYYLSRSGAQHPGGDDVLATQNPDGVAVVRDVILADYPTPVVFFKQMAHHLRGLDLSFLQECENVILTRHPRDMLASLTVQLPDATLEATGLPMQVELLEAMLAQGLEPVVVESTVLLQDPPSVLARLCERLGIRFDPVMLSWPPGPKPEDGVWARHWYDNVHNSTGFAPYRPKTEAFPEHLEGLLAECLPLYECLTEHALQPT